MDTDTANNLLHTLKRILAAHQSGNNGAIMGEAVLCRHFELMAVDAIERVERASDRR